MSAARPLARIAVLDSLSDPARPEAENEDRIGWNETAAFVIDGATGLGEPVVAPPASDAAWIAEGAKRYLEAELAPERAVRDVVRDFNALACVRFRAAAGSEIERYRHPCAGFQSLRLAATGFETAGLADCSLLLKDAGGNVTRYSGLAGGRAAEQRGARRAIARLGGLGADGEGYRDATTLAELRASRARLNTPGGVWTLGIDPEAATHIRVQPLGIALPATALLCSDGFADLADNYDVCTAATLIERAENEGLRPLLEALRHVERDVDPQGLRFPRYKRCDDASAILLRLGA